MTDNHSRSIRLEYDPFTELSTAAKYLIRGWETRPNDGLDIRLLLHDDIDEATFEKKVPETWTIQMVELIAGEVLLDSDIPPLLTYISARFGMNYDYAEYLFDDFYAGYKMSLQAEESDLVN